MYVGIALRFANKFAIDHTCIPKDEIQEMGEYFSDKELIELIAFCSFITASQKFGSCLGLQSSTYYLDKASADCQIVCITE